ncbi:MAG: glycoside hydrolase family 5 protein, partial [Ruminiclostridium sp.]|nr:glycoside hydrolase family 5 protein [Ruminiclostridium sp.]
MGDLTDGSGGQTEQSAQTEETSAATEAAVPEFDDSLTTAQIIKDMGLGINLGNTLESCGNWISTEGGVTAYETAWGSPIITKEIIQGYADSGFGVLRIPVAWSNLIAEDYTISEELMARVKEVTQWTLETGMYAIVNIHWDSGWWEKFPTDKENCMNKYTKIWEQITREFKDFNGKLMFESL